MLEALVASLPNDEKEQDFKEIKVLVQQTFSTDESLTDFINYAATQELRLNQSTINLLNEL